MDAPRVVSDPEILGGTPVFVGTRVPVRVLFEHLEGGGQVTVEGDSTDGIVLLRVRNPMALDNSQAKAGQ